MCPPSGNIRDLEKHLGQRPEEEKLFQTLRALAHSISGFMRARWKRSLPWGELMGDRWERAAELGFGEGTSVYDSCLIFGDVKVGRNVWVGPFTILDGTGGLEIGDGAVISAGVQVYSHDTVQRTVTGGKAPLEVAPTRIGARAYIGPQTVIAKGVTIGVGAVVGAHSLVLKNVPDGARVAGAPARELAGHSG